MDEMFTANWMGPPMLDRSEFVPVVSASRSELGVRAAADIAAEMRVRLSSQATVRMIFAAAPSQSEMLAALVAAPGIDWERVTAFHMDEYLGLTKDAPQRFGLWLRRNLFDLVRFGEVNLLEPGDDPDAAADAYAARLGEAPIDIVCCGIGSNGHLAFNDPPADLNDPKAVKVVALDEACRQQQVDDKCFAAFDDVPTHALTLTVPRLMAAERIFCCVPGSLKREAVQRTLEGPIDGMCPASGLRMHQRWGLYLDTESACGLSRVGTDR